ncbi:DUF4012 domain-containing protein [Nocardioides houyundeii]|uniref:DUF4012 domain-containing protein n=1 Tax=Nocardioides houyundeii TaxID=2045452 RepID=UPI000DF4B2B7|nr:DUF4012 domain-containing protein [Nocardioides houyundeii]
MTLRRALALLAVLLLAAVAYTGWTGWQVRGDLQAAEQNVSELQAALRDDDQAASDRAAQGLREHAAAAADGSSGGWWEALTVLPVLGDDVQGVRALSQSLNTLATDAVDPLLRSAELAKQLPTGGGLSMPVIDELSEPVAEASEALARAADQVKGQDSSGYVGALQSRFDDYVDTVVSAESGLGGAETAIGLLPDMLGGDEPKDYLVVFQNNAEIRASGGMPGNFARIHAEKGRLTLVDQGTAAQFGERSSPVLPLTEGEREVYGEQLGTYFQDANFTSDFPRTAELMKTRWEQELKRPGQLDGVLSLDPVAMSYLLDGTGPVQVQDQTLTSENAVEVLLSQTYAKRGLLEQDAFFNEAARKIFEAMTGDLASPVSFVQGLSRAAREGRLLVHSFDAAEQAELAGTAVAGELPTDASGRPYVDVELNDATASKMSYYLRYDTQVKAVGCEDGVQELSGSMVMHQTISPREAEALGASVTGPGDSVELGEQIVFVRIHGPVGGSFGRMVIDGEVQDVRTVDLNGRPVATLLMALTSRQQVMITWQMDTGEGQTGAGKVGVTPSVVPGNKDSEFSSAC